ncbi:hypothetical protein FB446DRAFT_792969 [Lentinula raphanica]|nr:hypothetical protein FB446DRAFT_792969 [Lentinula raphanica]
MSKYNDQNICAPSAVFKCLPPPSKLSLIIRSSFHLRAFLEGLLQLYAPPPQAQASFVPYPIGNASNLSSPSTTMTSTTRPLDMLPEDDEEFFYDLRSEVDDDESVQVEILDEALGPSRYVSTCHYITLKKGYDSGAWLFNDGTIPIHSRTRIPRSKELFEMSFELQRSKSEGSNFSFKAKTAPSPTSKHIKPSTVKITKTRSETIFSKPRPPIKTALVNTKKYLQSSIWTVLHSMYVTFLADLNYGSEGGAPVHPSILKAQHQQQSTTPFGHTEESR